MERSELSKSKSTSISVGKVCYHIKISPAWTGHSWSVSSHLYLYPLCRKGWAGGEELNNSNCTSGMLLSKSWPKHRREQSGQRLYQGQVRNHEPLVLRLDVCNVRKGIGTNGIRTIFLFNQREEVGGQTVTKALQSLGKLSSFNWSRPISIEMAEDILPIWDVLP